MKLLFRQYLASLRERDELDAILPERLKRKLPRFTHRANHREHALR